MKIIVILVAVAICVGRFFVTGHPLSLEGAYEAFAHLFVGGLNGAAIMAWMISKRIYPWNDDGLARRMSSVARWRWPLLGIIAAMSAVEIFAFATR